MRTRLFVCVGAALLLGAGCAGAPLVSPDRETRTGVQEQVGIATSTTFPPPAGSRLPSDISSSTSGTDSPLPTPVTTAAFDAPITLAPGETVLVGGELRVTLARINDSRCKEGVVCVWEGELGAELSVAVENGGEAETVILGTRTAPKKNVFLRDLELVAVTERDATIRVSGVPAIEAQEE